MEKIVSKKLLTFLESNNLLYEHGFRAKKSTIHPINHLLNDIAIANDKPTKDVTLGLFIDLSKVFDTVSHDILLSKMYKLGIRGTANDWFKSYLTDRQQYVQVGKENQLGNQLTVEYHKDPYWALSLSLYI